MKITRFGPIVAGLALIGSGVVVSTAVATPPSGSIGPVAPPVLATLEGRLKASQDGASLKINGDMTVRSFDLKYAPGSSSGWHAHPGIVLAVVVEGSVVRQVGCATETFTVGQAFTEVDPHLVSNPGTTDAVLRITQIFPADTDLTKLRLDEAAPDCGAENS